MKIAIPVNEKNQKSEICISFGRTPFFMIYNDETDEKVFLDNNAADSQGGAGIKAAQSLADNGINILITPRCGENAAKVLCEAKIAIYKTADGSAEENIKAYKENRLLLLSDIHKGFHNHGQ